MPIPTNKSDSDELFAAEWNAAAAAINASLKADGTVDSTIRQRFLGGITTPSIINGAGTLTLPVDINDTLIGRATTDTITGLKTFQSGKLMAANIGPDVNSLHTLPVVAADTFLLINATQSVLNKTIGATNDVTARSLLIGAVLVDVYTGTTPAAGQVLTMTSPTLARFQAPNTLSVKSDGTTIGAASIINFISTGTSIVADGVIPNQINVPTGAMLIQASGVSSGMAYGINFGSGLAVSLVSGIATVGVTGGAGAALTVQQGGSTVGSASSINLINFVGATVTTNGPTGVTVTIAGGGGGGSGNFSTPSTVDLDMGGGGIGHRITNILGMAFSGAASNTSFSLNGADLILNIPSVASGGIDGYFYVNRGGVDIVKIGKTSPGGTISLSALNSDFYVGSSFANVGTQPTTSGTGGGILLDYLLYFRGFTSPANTLGIAGETFRAADGHLYYNNGVSGQSAVCLDTVISAGSGITITAGLGTSSNVLTISSTGGGGGGGFSSPATTDLNMNGHNITNLVEIHSNSQFTVQVDGLQRLTVSNTGLGVVGGINTGNYPISGLPTPTQSDHAANKAYVDTHAGGTGPQGPQGPAGPTGPAGNFTTPANQTLNMNGQVIAQCYNGIYFGGASGGNGPFIYQTGGNLIASNGGAAFVFGQAAFRLPTTSNNGSASGDLWFDGSHLYFNRNGSVFQLV